MSGIRHLLGFSEGFVLRCMTPYHLAYRVAVKLLQCFMGLLRGFLLAHFPTPPPQPIVLGMGSGSQILGGWMSFYIISQVLEIGVEGVRGKGIGYGIGNGKGIGKGIEIGIRKGWGAS